MSWSGAIPREADQSDSRILIDACLARVREDAGLDDESVLTPLDVLIGKPDRTLPPRIVVEPAARPVTSGDEIAVSAVSTSGLARTLAEALNPPAEVGLRPASSPPPRRSEVETVRAPKPASPAGHRLRWPVVLCGFIGFLFGGMALMRSPVGQRPAVQHVMMTAADHVGAAYAATVAVTARLANR